MHGRVRKLFSSEKSGLSELRWSLGAVGYSSIVLKPKVVLLTCISPNQAIYFMYIMHLFY